MPTSLPPSSSNIRLTISSSRCRCSSREWWQPRTYHPMTSNKWCSLLIREWPRTMEGLCQVLNNMAVWEDRCSRTSSPMGNNSSWLVIVVARGRACQTHSNRTRLNNQQILWWASWTWGTWLPRSPTRRFWISKLRRSWSPWLRTLCCRSQTLHASWPSTEGLMCWRRMMWSLQLRSCTTSRFLSNSSSKMWMPIKSFPQVWLVLEEYPLD